MGERVFSDIGTSKMTIILNPSSLRISALTNENIQDMLKRGVLTDKCPIAPERLRIVAVPHINFDGKIVAGEIMVLDAVAKYVQKIFETLFAMKFPIAKVNLMTVYNGSDTASMEDNNTSAFNDRDIAGKKQKSIHSYGLAIDINPIQNPFVEFDYDTGTAKYSPVQGAKFANRRDDRPGKAKRSGLAEEVVPIFKANGFDVWGGNWDTPIDYQHFQVSRDMAETLASMKPAEAIHHFDEHVQNLKVS